MKNRYIILFLLGLVTINFSCEDGNKNFTDEFDSVFYYQKEGVNEFDFYCVNSAEVQTITIGRGGHGLTGTTTVKLIPFTQEEMDEYNDVVDGNYKLLAPEYYEMPASAVFEDGVEYRNVDVLFKGKMSELAKTGEYMLPIHLEADGKPVNDNKRIIYFKPNIKVPSIITEPSGVHVVRMNEGKREKQRFELSFYLDVRNEWDLKLRIENDENELQKAVDQYNERMGVDYLLLPKKNRSFESTILFPAGEALATSFVGISNENLLMDDYLIPIIPKKVAGMPFDVRETVCFIHVMVTGELDEIPLKAEMLTASSTDGGNVIGRVIDGKLDTHWESIWATNVNPKHDPVYGVYIDIDLSGSGQSFNRRVAIDYATRSENNAVPNSIIIYAGTNKDNLRKVGELSRIKDNLPVGKNEWTQNLPQFSLGRQEATLIRISILSSYGGSSVKNLTNPEFSTSGNQNCVAISELRLRGK